MNIHGHCQPKGTADGFLRIRVRFQILKTLAILLSLFGLAANASFSFSQDPNSTTERRLAQFRERRVDILLNLRHELTELSRQCFENGLTEAAQDVTAILLELTTPSEGAPLPLLAQLPVSNRLPSNEQLWRNRLVTVRNEKAKELYSLARQALRADLP